MRRAVPALLLLVGGLSACGGDPAEDYCDAVEEHQAELGEITGEGGADAFLRALPILTELQAQAPGDIADEWQQVVGRLEALDEALRDAGVEPSAYAGGDPHAGLTEEERARVEGAATELGSRETQQALAALEQQARDVCQTPLVL